MKATWFAAAVVFLSAAGSLEAASPCGQCHAKQTEHFAQSGMAQALHRAGDAVRQTMRGTVSGYAYEVAPKAEGGDPVYRVTDGTATLQMPLTWVVGQGTTGQTYLFTQEGQWYESRVSFYPALAGLDLTIGAQSIKPHTLREQAGRPLTALEMRQCLQCHATGVGTPAMTPGVQCERCHGGAAAHVQSRQAMRKLGRLTAMEQADFCGECHRTWATVANNGPRDIQNVRFQPYRLTNSKCFDPTDSRIRCTACHDPHQPLQKTAAAYDARCVACHAANAAPRTSAAKHVCKVSTHDCTTCHMPRLPLPGAHSSFTDHWIRIVRPGAPYPS